MRGPLAILLLAAPLAAEPAIRWIDEQGEMHRAALHAVEKEAAAEVVVKLENGQSLALPGRLLVDLRREDEQDGDQRALLHARQRVARHDAATPELRETLDRLAAKEGWVGEHASAWRAILAVHAGEPDAAARVDAYLGKHGTSRLACDVLVARAWLRSVGLEEPTRIQDCFVEASRSIEEMDGPMVARLRAVVESARRAVEEARARPDFDLGFSLKICGNVIDHLSRGADYATFLLAQDARLTILIEHEQKKARLQELDGHKPYGVLATARRMRDPLLLPQTRCAIERHIGLLHEACGDPAGARKAFEAALKDADEEQRPAIERDLGRVKGSG